MPVSIEIPPTPPQETLELSSFRRVLRNRNFLLLWLAQLISLIVFNAANFGLIVLVNNTTRSVLMAGLAIIAFTLPAVPFSALAGVFVDRLDKRHVLWVSNILRMLLMLLLVISLQYDRTNLWPLFALTFLISLVGQFFMPAEGAAIPLLVGKRELVPALSLFNITLTVSQAIGFLLLGRIVATIFPPFTLALGPLILHMQSIDMLFVIAAIFYLVCVGLILGIPAEAFHETHIHERAERTRKRLRESIGPVWRDIMVGWHVIRKDRLLFFAVIQLSVVGDIMLLIGELAGPFVQQIMRRPAEDMSIVLAPAAIGLVGMSVLMPRISERVEKVRLTVIAWLILALGLLLLLLCQGLALQLDPVHGGQSSLLLWSTIILLLLLGAAMAGVNIPTQTLMQARTPEAARGRVFSLQFMLYNTGSIPILLFAGIAAQFIGLTQFIVVVSISMLLFCWWSSHYARGGEPPPSIPHTP